MTPIHICDGEALLGDLLMPRTITIEGSRIRAIGPCSVPAGFGSVIDASGLTVSPGFTDLHVTAGRGIDLVDQPGAMWDLGPLLARHGVTSFLPTILSSPPDVTDAALWSLKRRPHDYVGAEPLGLHFVGPMLNPNRRGANRADHLAAPDPALIEHWSRGRGVSMVTIAPELPDAWLCISELAGRGVVVAAGHSEASEAEALAAVDAGLSAVVNLFDAMPPSDPRDPGLAGVALADRRLVAGLVVDGFRVDRRAVSTAWSAKGASGIALAIDAATAIDAPRPHQFGIDTAVRNLIDYTGCTPTDALLAATRTPTDLIRTKTRGRLEAGAFADIVMLDSDLNVEMTICAGQVGYVASSALDRMSTQLRRIA